MSAVVEREVDGVMSALLVAGMKAANASAVPGEDSTFHQISLEHIAALVSRQYGAGALFRELCTQSALVLSAKGRNVRVGEICFRRQQDVWTFEVDFGLDESLGQGLVTCGRLVTVLANLLEELASVWEDGLFNPNGECEADSDAWNVLYRSIPENELMRHAKSLFVIAGVLYQWSRS